LGLSEEEKKDDEIIMKKWKKFYADKARKKEYMKKYRKTKSKK